MTEKFTLRERRKKKKCLNFSSAQLDASTMKWVNFAWNGEHSVNLGKSYPDGDKEITFLLRGQYLSGKKENKGEIWKSDAGENGWEKMSEFILRYRPIKTSCNLKN